MEEKDCSKRRKDDAVRVEGRDEVVNEFCAQRKGGVWKACGDNGSYKKRKASWEDADMDPEIQHLIETMWEVDNCPPSLTGEITLLMNKIQKPRSTLPPRPPRPPARPPQRKVQRVYKIEHLMTHTNQGV